MTDGTNLGLQLAHALEALRALDKDWEDQKAEHKERRENLLEEVNRIKVEILTGQKRLFTEPMPAKDINRCAVCGWPLSESAEKGCVRGNCSLRPRPENLYDEERAKKEAADLLTLPATMPAVRAESPQDVPPAKEGDELYPQAVQCVLLAGKGSATVLQKAFSIGYGRAVKLLDEMERQGVVGPADGVNARTVLSKSESSDGEQATV